jgi:hypothetical protein
VFGITIVAPPILLSDGLTLDATVSRDGNINLPQSDPLEVRTVPEPSAPALLGLGAVGRRRRCRGWRAVGVLS